MDELFAFIFFIFFITAMALGTSVERSRNVILRAESFKGTINGEVVEGHLVDVGSKTDPEKLVLTEDKLWRIDEDGEWEECNESRHSQITENLTEWQEIRKVKAAVEQSTSEKE